MDVGDVVQFRTKYDYQGEDMSNVYYYRCTSVVPPVTAQDFIDAVQVTLMPKIYDITHVDATYRQLVAINGMDNSDAAVELVTEAGNSTFTAASPSFVSVGLRCPPVQPGQHYSYKRYGGVPMEIELADGAWKASYVAVIVALQEELDDDTSGFGGEWEPVQITGGFTLGITPVVARVLSNPWQHDLIPTHQDTRQLYDWNF